MSFRLTKEESFSDGIRRIVVEQLKKAADPLSNLKKVDRGVHEARRAIKKVRGVLRLIQPEMASAYRAEDGQLRTLGRGLANLRDDAVMLEVFDSLLVTLLQTKRGRRFEAIRKGLEQRQQETKKVKDIADIFQETRSGLHAITKRVEDWPVPHDLPTVTTSGFEATYQRGKAALEAALENPIPDNLHRFRKRVKEHRFHLSLLSVSAKETKRIQDLRQLEALLGDDHNLSVLREELDRHPEQYGDPLDISAFLAVVTRKQRQLQAKLFPLSRRLYAMEESTTLVPVLRHTA